MDGDLVLRIERSSAAKFWKKTYPTTVIISKNKRKHDKEKGKQLSACAIFTS